MIDIRSITSLTLLLTACSSEAADAARITSPDNTQIDRELLRSARVEVRSAPGAGIGVREVQVRPLSDGELSTGQTGVDGVANLEFAGVPNGTSAVCTVKNVAGDRLFYGNVFVTPNIVVRVPRRRVLSMGLSSVPGLRYESCTIAIYNTSFGAVTSPTMLAKTSPAPDGAIRVPVFAHTFTRELEVHVHPADGSSVVHRLPLEDLQRAPTAILQWDHSVRSVLVTDTHGAPVDGALVSSVSTRSLPRRLTVMTCKGTTDQDGRFHVYGPDGRLVVSKRGYAAQEIDWSHQEEELTVTLRQYDQDQRIWGTVRRSDGTAVEGARVAVKAIQTEFAVTIPQRTVTTDSQGQFSAAVIHDGLHQVETWLDSEMARVTARSGNVGNLGAHFRHRVTLELVTSVDDTVYRSGAVQYLVHAANDEGDHRVVWVGHSFGSPPPLVLGNGVYGIAAWLPGAAVVGYARIRVQGPLTKKISCVKSTEFATLLREGQGGSTVLEVAKWMTLATLAEYR